MRTINKETGWIKLTRSLLDSSLWKVDEKFDSRSAFIDLMLMANFTEGQFTADKNREVVDVYPGQVFTSYKNLADRWHWDRKTVIRFLRWLVKLELIQVTTFARCGTSITLVNYDGSPVRRTQGGTQVGTQGGTYVRTHERTQIGTQGGTRYKKGKTDKTGNNDKKEKNSAKRRVNLWEGAPEE